MINANWRWSKDIEQEILKEIVGRYPVIHICSGCSGLGDIRLDRITGQEVIDISRKDKVTGAPNVKGLMQKMPIKSGIADAVICDPPYDWMRHAKDFKSLIGELARITAPGGKMILIFPSILYHPTLELKRFWCRPAGKKFVPTYKILSVSIKTNGQISDYA